MLDVPPPQEKQRWDSTATWKMLTRLIDAVRGIGKARGDGYVNVKWEGNTPVFGVNVDRILRRSPRIGGGGGSGTGYPEITVICDEDIPAGSFAEIVCIYDGIAFVRRPSADNLSLAKLVVVLYKVLRHVEGKGLCDFGDASLVTDDDVVPGDIVGTRKGEWRGFRGAEVGLEVVSILTGCLARVRVISSSEYDPQSPTFPTVTIAAPADAKGTQATGYTVVNADGSLTVTLMDRGSKYGEQPKVKFGFGNAKAEAIISGSIDEIQVTNGGQYDSAPNVVIKSLDAGEGAAATAHIDESGVLTSITLDAGKRGMYYLTPPTISLFGGGGSGGGKAVAVLA